MDVNTIKNISFFGALFTLLVISVGAWVRLTDAGLGCPDWPGCYGLLTPPISDLELSQAKNTYPDAIIDAGKAWREMLHRYLAGILGLYVFFTAYLTFKYSKNTSNILPIALIVLIIIQSIMGMLTVTELVKPTIVTIHLILGMSTASLMYWNGLKVVANHNMINLNKTLILIIILCIFGLLTQIILGGWTSTNYASLACTDFPKCSNQWWPNNMDFKSGFTIFNLPNINYEGGPLEYNAKLAVHFTHRIGALILSLLFLWLFIYLFFLQANKNIKKIGMVVMALFVAQIMLGISNIIFSLPISIAVLHTVNASALLMSMVALLYYSTYNTQK